MQAPDCIQEAAWFYGVNEVVLRAIAWQEACMDPSAVDRELERHGGHGQEAYQQRALA